MKELQITSQRRFILVKPLLSKGWEVLWLINKNNKELTNFVVRYIIDVYSVAQSFIKANQSIEVHVLQSVTNINSHFLHLCQNVKSEWNNNSKETVLLLWLQVLIITSKVFILTKQNSVYNFFFNHVEWISDIEAIYFMPILCTFKICNNCSHYASIFWKIENFWGIILTVFSMMSRHLVFPSFPTISFREIFH